MARGESVADFASSIGLSKANILFALHIRDFVLEDKAKEDKRLGKICALRYRNRLKKMRTSFSFHNEKSLKAEIVELKEEVTSLDEDVADLYKDLEDLQKDYDNKCKDNFLLKSLKFFKFL